MDDDSEGAGQARHRVLWDGDCVFCGRAARWCQRKDAAGRLELVERIPEDRRGGVIEMLDIYSGLT